MISRRDVLFRAAAAGAAVLAGRVPDLFAKAAQPSTPVNFSMPLGACDCHTHIFGDPQRFPMIPTRVYTPETASIAEMQALHRALHTQRVVIVNPSVYGATNDCTLDAVKRQSPNARGVAVIDDKTTDAALDAMARGGIAGIRVNLETTGVIDPAVCRQRVQAAIERIGGRMKGRNWHIELYTRLSVVEALKDIITASPVQIEIDHFGGAEARLGVAQPGFDTLLGLVRSGKAYVKISAPYRSSTQAPDYPDVAPLAKALIAANPQRILWGTDWPHPDSRVLPGRKSTDIAPLYQIDDGRVLTQLALWAPDAALRKVILVDNPARLYGF
jgi:predicted TIM-barrel fold metal-dependent hydrolase